MTLRQKQSEFVRFVGLFIQYAYILGYELTFGDAYAKTGHKKNSFHYNRLAIDFNAFKGGKYLRKTEEWQELGEVWEGFNSNCTWGGRFKNKDGNHLSWGE